MSNLAERLELAEGLEADIVAAPEGWVATTAQLPGLQGRGKTSEEARKNLIDLALRELAQRLELAAQSHVALPQGIYHINLEPDPDVPGEWHATVAEVPTVNAHGATPEAATRSAIMQIAEELDPALQDAWDSEDAAACEAARDEPTEPAEAVYKRLGL